MTLERGVRRSRQALDTRKGCTIWGLRLCADPLVDVVREG